MPQTNQIAREKWRSIAIEDAASLDGVGWILLASEGRPISQEAIRKAADLAIHEHANVHVLSVARIWGSAFGMQHPGLMPTAHELRSQREIVSEAIDVLEQLGVLAKGEIIRSRNAAQAIGTQTRRSIYHAIVMTADRAPHWLVRGLLWSHEPHRVRRFTRVPVHLVVQSSAGASG